MFELVLAKAPVRVGAALVRLADSPFLVVFAGREEKGRGASSCREVETSNKT